MVTRKNWSGMVPAALAHEPSVTLVCPLTTTSGAAVLKVSWAARLPLGVHWGGDPLEEELAAGAQVGPLPGEPVLEAFPPTDAEDAFPPTDAEDAFPPTDAEDAFAPTDADAFPSREDAAPPLDDEAFPVTDDDVSPPPEEDVFPSVKEDPLPPLDEDALPM